MTFEVNNVHLFLVIMILKISKIREKTMSKDNKKKKGLQMPHTYVIIFGVIILCALLTVFVPVGSFETKQISYEHNGVTKTRNVVDPGSFRYELDENGNIKNSVNYPAVFAARKNHRITVLAEDNPAVSSLIADFADKNDGKVTCSGKNGNLLPPFLWMVICLVLWVLANYIFAVISHLRASFPAVLLLSVRLMAGHIKETFILLFTMAGACLIVFLVPGLFVLFPGILCGIASHLIEPGLKRLLLLINPVLYSQNCGILLSDRIRSSPRMPCRQMLR